MFSHVTVLISFIFAIAVTHLFTSTTELIWAHDRVRISWLQIVWMLNALVGVMIGWMGMFYLSKRTSWDAAEVAINFAGAGVQYFTCSLISIRPKDEGTIDMPAFYARVRPYVGSVFAASCAIGMFENWSDRDMMPTADGWVYADLAVLPMVIFCLLGGWARPLWLQWIGAIGMLLIQGYFFSGVVSSG